MFVLGNAHWTARFNDNPQHKILIVFLMFCVFFVLLFPFYQRVSYSKHQSVNRASSAELIFIEFGGKKELNLHFPAKKDTIELWVRACVSCWNINTISCFVLSNDLFVCLSLSLYLSPSVSLCALSVSIELRNRFGALST